MELKGQFWWLLGINGTVSGTVEATNKYMDYMANDARFADMVFKIDAADAHAFKKMHVRPRAEIVSLSLEEDVNPLEVTGTYLEPSEFREALLDEDTVILDARNDYEFDIGHFRGAVRPDIQNFRELPGWIEDNREQLADKKIVTYCTGGIRCEKFSGWLKTAGFDDVSQLHGGIATYGKNEETKGELWDGQMYVFDERIAVPINQVNPTIVGKDYLTARLANVTSIVLTRIAISKSWLLSKMRKSICVVVRMIVVFIQQIFIRKIYLKKNSLNAFKQLMNLHQKWFNK